MYGNSLPRSGYGIVARVISIRIALPRSGYGIVAKHQLVNNTFKFISGTTLCHGRIFLCRVHQFPVLQCFFIKS
jgi:hypothetical protein